MAPVQVVIHQVRRAHRLLWLGLLFFGLAMGIGFNWDRAWHSTHPFEDFWSPPHLFIYVMFGLCAGVTARMAADPGVRQVLGSAMTLPGLPLAVPASLVLLSLGVATIGLAGGLDSIWHSTFGLDETSWSTPHAMLGWGLLLTFFGFLAVRWGLRTHRPLSWLTTGFFALLALAFLVNIPLAQLDRTRELAEATALLPVLAADPNVQHIYRVYAQWDLTRQSILFLPLAAAAVGAGLAVLRRLVPNVWLALLVSLVLTGITVAGDRRTAAYFGLADDPRTWAPLAIAPALVAFLVLHRFRLPPRVAWTAAGLLFGLLGVPIWGQPAATAVFTGLTMPLGADFGERLWRVIDRPTRRGVLLTTSIISLAIPVSLGVVDLYLRSRTPWANP